ncbi:MAG: M50 family metallopeptidase [Planctomycetota bacterium]
MSDELTAWHEAGHAIMAAALGGSVRRVSIYSEDEEQAGSTAVEWRGGYSTSKEHAMREIRVSLAGPVAEMIYAGEYDSLRVQSAHALDWEIAMAHTRAITQNPEKQHRLLQDIVNELYHFLRDDNVHAALGDLADQLLTHDEVEAESVAQIARQWLR